MPALRVGRRSSRLKSGKGEIKMSMLRKLVMMLLMSVAVSYPLAANAQGKEKASDKKQMTEEEKAAADMEKALKRAKASEVRCGSKTCRRSWSAWHFWSAGRLASSL